MRLPDAIPTRPDLTIVVPTYNERDRLDPLLEQMFQAADAYRIGMQVIVVDDNSSDGTGARADEWSRRRSVRVVHRAGKLGLGSAVLDGFALANSDIVGVMDADLSHPPDLIPSLYSTITRGDLDMVVASRYIRDAGTRGWPLGRLLLSRIACWMARPLTPVRDATSGFFLLRRERLGGFRTSVRGFKIGLELLVRARPKRVAEVGYVFVGRTTGESKMSLRECVRFLRQLVSLYAAAVSPSALRHRSGQAARPGHLIVPASSPPPRPRAIGRVRV